MAVTKPDPATLPRFANVSGDVVEPSDAKKDAGWVAAEKPAAQFFNWLLLNIYLWLLWLSDPAKLGHASGTMLRGDRTEIVGPSSAQGGDGGWLFVGTSWLSISGAGAIALRHDLPVTVGDRIKAVSAYVKSHNSSGGALTVKLLSYDPSTDTETQIGTTHTSAHAGAIQSIVLLLDGGADGSPVTMVAKSYRLLIEANDTSFGDMRYMGAGLITDCVA